jgi:hypothetical protein
MATDLVGSLRDLGRRDGLNWPDVAAAADWLDEERLIVRRRDRAISLPTRQHGGAVIGLMGLPCAGKSFFMETALALGVPWLYVGALIRMKFGDDAFDLSPVDKIELLR